MFLYSFKRCPFAIRARMTLLACGIKYEHREVNLKQKPDSLIKYSPKATVPVLVLNDSEIIDESFDIMLWAIRQKDPLSLGCDSKYETIVEDCMQNFLPGVYHCKYPERYDVDINAARNANIAWLAKFEQELATKKFLVSNRITYIDLAIFPFIRQWWHIEPDSEFVKINNWLEDIKAKEFYKLAMQNFEVWQD